MTNPFNKLSNDGLEQTRDTLGGGGGLFDSGVYDGTIKTAYAGQSSGGAQYLQVEVQAGDRTYRETIYVTNKGGDNFYMTPDKKKAPLPGFTAANDLCLLTTEKGLHEQDFEERVVNIRDFEQNKDIPTKVQMAVELLGKPVKLGILRIKKNKQVKNEATGQYEPTNEVREENRIDKVFQHETGMTVREYLDEKSEAEFLPKWQEKNDGVTRDQFKEVTGPGKSGVPGRSAPAAGAAPAKSLFGKKG